MDFDIAFHGCGFGFAVFNRIQFWFVSLRILGKLLTTYYALYPNYLMLRKMLAALYVAPICTFELVSPYYTNTLLICISMYINLGIICIVVLLCCLYLVAILVCDTMHYLCISCDVVMVCVPCYSLHCFFMLHYLIIMCIVVLLLYLYLSVHVQCAH